MKYSMLVHKQTGMKAIRINETGRIIKESEDKALYMELRSRIIRNKNKREENEMLRELTGTSARAARLDMGL